MIAPISSFGFISSVSGSDTTWISTTSANEKITFRDAVGNQLDVNSLMLYASGSAIYVQIDDGGIVYIAANDSISIDGLIIHDITVIGGSPITLRYYCLYK